MHFADCNTLQIAPCHPWYTYLSRDLATRHLVVTTLHLAAGKDSGSSVRIQRDLPALEQITPGFPRYEACSLVCRRATRGPLP